jgi:sugar phosphate isomerase/epimerase
MSSAVDTKMSINFRDATDKLFEVVTHDELAQALGCSVATIRQARRTEGTPAYRTPPKGWEKAVLKLAEERAEHFKRLIAKLKAI